MTDTDKLEIKEIIQDALNPINEKLEHLARDEREIYQSLFGIDGTNGMNRDLKHLKTEIDALRTFKTQVVSIFTAVQAAVVLIVQILIFWLKSKTPRRRSFASLKRVFDYLL